MMFHLSASLVCTTAGHALAWCAWHASRGKQTALSAPAIGAPDHGNEAMPGATQEPSSPREGASAPDASSRVHGCVLHVRGALACTRALVHVMYVCPHARMRGFMDACILHPRVRECIHSQPKQQ